MANLLTLPWASALFSLDSTRMQPYLNATLAMVDRVDNALLPHLRAAGIDVTMAVYRWMQPMFVTAPLPFPLKCRLWDAVLLDGSTGVCRAAAAIMLCLGPALRTAHELEDIYGLLRVRT